MASLHKLKILFKNQKLKRYAANTSWMMVEQMLRIIAGLFVGIWVARYLGPAQFGIFSYVLAFTSIFAGIAKLGLDSIMVRELVNNPEQRDTYLGTAFWLKIIAAFFIMGVMASIMPFTSNNTTINLFIFIIAAGLVFQSFEVVEFYFQSQVMAKFVSISKIFQLLLSSLIKIYLVISKAELIWFVFVTVFDALSLAVSYLIVYKFHRKSSIYKHFDLDIAKLLIYDGWPLIFAGLGFTLFSNIDLIMIKEMMDETSVGIYSAAYKLTTLWYFIPGLVLNSVLPAIVIVKDDLHLFQKRMQTITGLLIWLAIIIAISTTFFAEKIIDITFGYKYKNSADILVFLVWINVMIFFNSCWNYFNIINNKTRWIMYFHFSVVLLNIIFNLVFIPILGLIGVALSILFSLLTCSVIFSIIDKNTLPLFINSLFFWRLYK